MTPVFERWYDNEQAHERQAAEAAAEAMRGRLEAAGLSARVADDPPWLDWGTYVFGSAGRFLVLVAAADEKRARDVLGPDAAVLTVPYHG